MAGKLFYHLTCSYMWTLFICKQSKIFATIVFQSGELHVVFTSLNVLDKLIDGSRLDQAFEEASRITVILLIYYSLKKWFQWFLKSKPSSLLLLGKLITLQELHITHFLWGTPNLSSDCKVQPEFLKTCFLHEENMYCIFTNKLPPSFKGLF